MNTILLNGNPAVRRLPLADRTRDLLAADFAARQWRVAIHELATMTIRPCLGCFGCWLKTPGRCVIRDDGDRMIGDLAGAELLALLTPITFGGYGYDLKKAMDRCIPIVMPFMKTRDGETHHPHRYPVRRRLLAVGLLPEPDPQSEAVFRRLVARHALNLAATAVSVLVVDGTDERLEARMKSAVDTLEVT